MIVVLIGNCDEQLVSRLRERYQDLLRPPVGSEINLAVVRVTVDDHAG